jgi:GTPase
VKFVDEVTIEVASGHGGPGCVSFRREKFVPRGGPDGGDGGRGGHIIFRVDSRLHSLLDLRFQKKYLAPDGEPGGTQNKTGKDGADMILSVPPGTEIKTLEGQLIRDLAENDEEFLFLKGGIGGKGNTFYKSSVNQAPEVAQKGMPGAAAQIHLELKLLADVGIIGFPNAGKSTLISRISAAKPKVADYPFTTLIPNLGVVRYGDDRSYVVADMPGLIKGAHEGAGLGHRFLKHIERTKFFLHMIDISGASGRAPLQDYQDINEELRLYDAELSKRRQLVALNKIDALMPEAVEEIVEEFRALGVDVFPISAVSGMNIEKLKYEMGRLVFSET